MHGGMLCIVRMNVGGGTDSDLITLCPLTLIAPHSVAVGGGAQLRRHPFLDSCPRVFQKVTTKSNQH